VNQRIFFRKRICLMWESVVHIMKLHDSDTVSGTHPICNTKTHGL